MKGPAGSGRPAVAYRFGSFALSPARRQLLNGGREIPLNPRYFDLLVLLVERRAEAIPRRDIVTAVWSDVVVTDGALNQGVRILRRVLDDDHRDPAFIRTVSRHGYQFVFSDVREVPEDEIRVAPSVARPTADDEDARRDALRTLLAAKGAATDEERAEAAERLHELGTPEALRAVDRSPGHERARAFLRDARLVVPGAGDVPLLGVPGAVKAATILVGLRLRRAVRLAGKRWAGAAGGGALAGAIAGVVGGTLLRYGPGSTARGGVPIALCVVGAAIGCVGAAGVGAGLAAAEVVARSARRVALVALGALGGGFVGAAAHLLALATLEGLFGADLSPVGGGVEGLGIGAGAGLGFALATAPAGGGMAAPRGRSRLVAVASTSLCCALAAALLAYRGRFLGAMSLDFMSHSFAGSQVALDPIARLLGESRPGLATRLVISAFEGAMFGAGVGFGLTRRVGNDSGR